MLAKQPHFELKDLDFTSKADLGAYLLLLATKLEILMASHSFILGFPFGAFLDGSH